MSPEHSNILAFAKLPRRIVICRFSKMFGFCTFSTAGGIVKVGSERLTFLLAGSWIMFRNEMNISLDLHIAQQLHLSTMYNKYGINLKICTTLSIWDNLLKINEVFPPFPWNLFPASSFSESFWEGFKKRETEEQLTGFSSFRTGSSGLSWCFRSPQSGPDDDEH